MSTEIIDLCSAGLCMERAVANVIAVVERDGKARSMPIGKLCERHIRVLEEHGAKRMKQEKGLSVVVDRVPLTSEVRA